MLRVRIIHLQKEELPIFLRCHSPLQLLYSSLIDSRRHIDESCKSFTIEGSVEYLCFSVGLLAALHYFLQSGHPFAWLPEAKLYIREDGRRVGGQLSHTVVDLGEIFALADGIRGQIPHGVHEFLNFAAQTLNDFLSLTQNVVIDGLQLSPEARHGSLVTVLLEGVDGIEETGLGDF